MREPSKAQREAIIHLSGPAVITAGPGSGKTFVIVNRILYLIQHHHIRPDNILVITYTKAAASEMKERCEKAFLSDRKLLEELSRQGISCHNIHFGTFHSVCYHILRQSGVVRGDCLIKENDKRKLLRMILGNHGLSSQCDYDTISNLENAISYRKNLGKMPAGKELSSKDGPAKFCAEKLRVLQEDYDNYLREQGRIDFDDMIGECLKFLTGNREALGRYRQLFRYILADEFQDMNPPQYEVLKLLASPSNNLFVVGDDDQAIYGFRGATPGIMKNFPADFPNSRQLMLTENYRCKTAIVKLSEKVISRNKERFAKKFYPMKSGGHVSEVCFDTRRQQEQELVCKLSALSKEELLNTAVILRTNRETGWYAGLLKDAHIPIKENRVADRAFYHGFIMEDVIAFLSYLYEGNRRGDFIRFMNCPDRFFTRSALPSERVDKEEMKRYYRQNPEMCREIDVFFRQLEIASGLSPHLAVGFFRKACQYDSYLRKKAKDYGEYQYWAAQADKVQDCFWQMRKGKNVREFVESLAEKEGKSEPLMEKRDGVSLLTMHGSKGLEFDRVFLPDLNEGVIPGKNISSGEALEEERRLLYVAMTRAKEELYLYCTKERGRKPSRYLEGLAFV